MWNSETSCKRNGKSERSGGNSQRRGKISFIHPSTTQLKSFPEFHKYTFHILQEIQDNIILDLVSLGILFVFIFLIITVSAGAALIGGTVCFIITIILFVIFLLYLEYRFFAAPVYIALLDVICFESLLYSWNFTRNNPYPPGFFIKRIIPFFIFLVWFIW